MNRDIIIVLVVRAFHAIVSLLTLKVMTMQLDPVDVGKISMLMVIYISFTVLAISPVGLYINRKFFIWYDNGLLKPSLAIAGLYLVAVVLLSVMLLFIITFYLDFNAGFALPWLVVLVAGILFFKTIQETILPAFNGIGMRFQWGIFTAIMLAVSLGSSWGLMWVHHSAEFWILGQIMGFALGGGLGLWYMVKVCPVKQDVDTSNFWTHKAVKEIFYFSFPTMIVLVLNWGQFQSYRILLGTSVSLEFLGLFIAAYTVSMGIINSFETTALYYYQPLFYKNISQYGEVTSENWGMISNAWEDYARTLIPMFFITGAFISGLAQPFLDLLTSQKYWGGTSYVIIGAIVETCRAIGSVYALGAHATMRIWQIVLPQIAGTLIVVLGLPVLLKFVDPDRAILCILVGGVFYVVLMHIRITRHLGVKLTGLNINMCISWAIILFVLGKLYALFTKSVLLDISAIGVVGIVYIYMIIIIARKNTYSSRIIIPHLTAIMDKIKQKL